MLLLTIETFLLLRSPIGGHRGWNIWNFLTDSEVTQRPRFEWNLEEHLEEVANLEISIRNFPNFVGRQAVGILVGDVVVAVVAAAGPVDAVSKTVCGGST